MGPDREPFDGWTSVDREDRTGSVAGFPKPRPGRPVLDDVVKEGHRFMATQSPPPAEVTEVLDPESLYRIPLEVYHAIAEHGLLTPRDKVVLLDGLLVKKMTKGGPHYVATKLVWEVLHELVPDGWHVQKEDPIALPGGSKGRDSEPEP